MPDYELHADYDRDGRLAASATEYGRRAIAPGAIVVPDFDADRRRLPASVQIGPRIVLDGEQPVAPANDDEQLPLRIVARASAPPGSRLFVRPVGFPRIRLRFNDGRGRILPRDLARGNDLPVSIPAPPGKLDLTVSTATVPGAPYGRVTSLDTRFRPPQSDESRFAVQLVSVDPAGRETLHDEAQFTIAPFVILDHSATAIRTYVCDHYENEPSVIELEAAHRELGVPLIKLDPEIGEGDTWLQDQFQHALIQGPDGWRQVIVHLPRLRSNTSSGTTKSNLATFVTSHFPSRNLGLFDDLWTRMLHVYDIQGAQHRIPFRECERIARAMQQVIIVATRLVDTIKSIAPAYDPQWPDTWTEHLAWVPQLLVELGARVRTVAAKKSQWSDTLKRTLQDFEARARQLADRAAVDPQRKTVRLQTSSGPLDLSLVDADRLHRRLFQMHHSANYGGNIDASPPTPDAPLGKIVIGNAIIDGQRDFMDPDLLHVLFQQRKQPVVALDTTWLHVGHVDEIMCFAPASGKPGTAFGVLHASPALALRLMEAARDRYLAGLSAADRLRYTDEPNGAQLRLLSDGASPVTRLFRGKVWLHFHPAPTGEQIPNLLEPPEIYLRVAQAMMGGIPTSVYGGGVNISGIRYWPGEGPVRTYPADITVKEVLYGEQDGDGKSTNRFIQIKHLDGAARILAKAFPRARMFPLPVLYDRVASVARWAESPLRFPTLAFVPNVVNMQAVNGRMMIPRPYGPRMLPDDAIAVIVDAVRALKLPDSLARRIDRRFIDRHRLTRGIYWIERQEPVQRPGTPAPYSGMSDEHTIYEGLETEAQIIDQFRDSFPGAGDDELRNRIIKPNRRHFDARGKLREGWRRFELDEGMVDLFEAYILAVAEEIDARVSWIDSWYYHVRAGEIHCGTNVLRVPRRPSGLPNIWSVPDIQYAPQPQEFEFAPLELGGDS
ncbi:MAG TPA: protein-arginine deiminase family protein [Casimicrobiaceae bacterium]